MMQLLQKLHEPDRHNNHDFSSGSIPQTILKLSIPLMIGQFISVLYNIVDRIYIGRISHANSDALTGIGVTSPIITVVTAFSYLISTGSTPLCSIARGKQKNRDAEEIIGNSFALLLLTGLVLTVIGLLTKKPLLYLLGASDATFPYANDYLSIYLLGNVFVMITLGMNGFINCQGFVGFGMATVIIGAILNLILDPLFIFVFQLGVKGAAIATVISQLISAIWVLRFLTGSRTLLKLRRCCMNLKFPLIRQILSLGLSGFIMQATNCMVQIVCNVSLQKFGGDPYVGVMTIINSIREILSIPVNGLTQGAQPVLGYNYGANKYSRVKSCIKVMSLISIGYTTIAWILTMIAPQFLILLFDGSGELLDIGTHAIRIYFFGFCFMSLQFSGQSVFTGLGKAKQAIFFSLLRKAIIVVPLTLLFPYIGNLGVHGVFLAEPISNLIGGTACFVTMLCTMWPKFSGGSLR